MMQEKHSFDFNLFLHSILKSIKIAEHKGAAYLKGFRTEPERF